MPKQIIQWSIVPPRDGYTHRNTTELVELGKGVSLGRAHNILRHQIRIAWDKIKEKNLKCLAVYITGKAQVKNCDRNFCDEACLLYPISQEEYFQYRNEISQAWKSKNIITQDDCPHHLCQYYFTLFAMEDADIIFAPSQLFPIIPPKGDLFLDEEIVLDAFTPQSVALIKLRSKPKEFEIEIPIPEFITLRERIHSFKKKSIQDKVILALIERWEQLALEFEKTARENAVKPIKEIAGTLCGYELEKIKVKKFDYSNNSKKEEVVGRINKLTLNFNEDVQKYLIALLYAESFYAQGLDEDPEVESDKITIYLIADERYFFNLDKLKKYGDIHLKGSFLAKDFCQEMEKEGYEIVKKENPEFRYKLNFWAIYVDSVFNVIKGLDGEVSALVLCGCKRDAYYLAQHLDAQFIANKKTSLDRIEYMYRGGHLVLFWNLSAISRGLDLPYFDILIVYTYQFSSPYEEVHYSEKDLEQLKLEETAQSCLRISPILGHYEDEPRLVILPERLIEKPVYEDGECVGTEIDLELHKRIPYLGQCTLLSRRSAEEAIAVVKNVTRGLKIRRRHNNATKSSDVSQEPKDFQKNTKEQKNPKLNNPKNPGKSSIFEVTPEKSFCFEEKVDVNCSENGFQERERCIDFSLLHATDMLTESLVNAISQKDTEKLKRINQNVFSLMAGEKPDGVEYNYLLGHVLDPSFYPNWSRNRRISTEVLVRKIAATSKVKDLAKIRRFLNLAYVCCDLNRDREENEYYWYPGRG